MMQASHTQPGFLAALVHRLSGIALAVFLPIHFLALSTALNGADALGAILRSRPDVVMLDINMPRMNGVEVLKDIKQIDDSIAVIMVTANEQVTMAAEALRSGAFGYVPKPFDFRYLDHMLATILDRLPRGPKR